MSDEIITEVYAIKDAIAEQFNYDLRLFFEEIKRGEMENRVRGLKFINPLSMSTNANASLGENNA